MKNLKKPLALILALILALSLCACGASGKSSAPAAPAEAYYATGAAMADTAEYEMTYAAEEAYWDGDAAYGLSASNTAQSASGADAPEADPEKIIYSADVTVETTAFDESLAKLDALVSQYGGWVESSSITGANFYDVSRGYQSNRSASYSLRIPSARFHELMNSLTELGNVPYTHSYTENVTAQYYDVQARLTAYQTQEARLLEMMEVAETVEDIILLEDRLTELRYQIESLQSTLNNWDRRVSYSSVYVELKEVREYTPEPVNKITFGRELQLALLDGIRGVGDFLSDLLLFLTEALPTLIVLGVLAAIIVPLVKKGRARRRAKKAAKAPVSGEPQDGAKTEPKAE